MVMQFLIVDDHPVLREGVAAVLRQTAGGAEVLHAEDGVSALAAIARRPDIDVVFLDLMLPGSGGLAVLEELGARHPGLPIIMLSSSEEPTDVRRALARGALGYVPKSASSSTLLAALQLVLAGEIYVPPFVVQETSGREAEPQVAVCAVLTDRQIEVLKLMAGAQTNKQIAYQLTVSEKTVKAHVTAIFRALRVASRAEAVRTAKAAALI
jgi:two-component system nitrate/nitrite response regulator NarL